MESQHKVRMAPLAATVTVDPLVMVTVELQACLERPRVRKVVVLCPLEPLYAASSLSLGPASATRTVLRKVTAARITRIFVAY